MTITEENRARRSPEKAANAGEGLCTKGSNPTHGSGWIFQILSTMSHVYEVLNPTNGSWWMVQIHSTQNRFSV